MVSPLEQIYAQADAGSAHGQSVGIGKTDQAPRNPVFSGDGGGGGPNRMFDLFDQQAGQFNATSNRMFAQMQQHSQQWLSQAAPTSSVVDPAGEAGPSAISSGAVDVGPGAMP